MTTLNVLLLGLKDLLDKSLKDLLDKEAHWKLKWDPSIKLCLKTAFTRRLEPRLRIAGSKCHKERVGHLGFVF